MNNNNERQGDVNRQDHPHQEGQQNNTAPLSSDQRNAGNQNQPMSNMEGPERRTGDGSPKQHDSQNS